MNRLIWRKKYFFCLLSYIFDICLEKYILNVGICSIFHVFTLYFFSSLFGSWRRCTAEWRMTGATSHAPLLWVVFACGPRHAHPQHLPHMRHGTASYGPFIIYYILKVVFASGPRHAYPQHLPHVEHGTFLVKNAIYKKSSLPVVPARNTPNICHNRGTEQS